RESIPRRWSTARILLNSTGRVKRRRRLGGWRLRACAHDFVEPQNALVETDELASNGGAGGGAGVRKPAVAVALGAASDGAEFALNALGERAARTIADLCAVDRADRSDLGGGAAEEHLVGDIEHFARDDLFGHRNAEIAAEVHHRVARDAR